MNSEVQSSRLKIVLAVVDYFDHGGMQRSFLRLAKELLARGHDVLACASTWEGERPKNLRIQVLATTARTNHGRNEEFGRRLLELKTSADFDCVVGFNKVPGLDIYYAGDPCWVTRCEDDGKSFLYRVTPRYRSYRRLEAAVFDWEQDCEIMLIAHREKENFQRIYDTDDQRFHLLPPGIDKERLDHQLAQPFDRDAFLTALDLDPKDGMVLIVGSGLKTKGVDRLIKSVAVFPKSLERFYSVVVVGRGDPREFEILATRLGIKARVRFVGPRDNVVDFYRAADVLGHPARLENTGTTLIEAMYCGLPVVATENCGFAHHLLQAGAGLVCPLPYEEKVFDRMLLEAIYSPRREDWIRQAKKYCQTKDLYGLIDAAADVVERRAVAIRG